jgi:putative endonuclease
LGVDLSVLQGAILLKIPTRSFVETMANLSKRTKPSGRPPLHDPKLSILVPSHFVYILTCADDTFYAGYTTDPKRRLREHNAGTASRYTRARLPVRLSFVERAPSRGEALRREIEIKKLSRKRKMLLCQEYASSGAPAHARLENQRASWLNR